MDEMTPEFYMKETIALAGEGLALGEAPIAAIVVYGGEIISKAITAEKREERTLVHAELFALQQADELKLPFMERRQAALYTNLEPCLMCMGAAMSFFLGEIHYALESPGDGAVELVKKWSKRGEDFLAYQLPKIRSGLLRRESQELFRKYIHISPPSPIRDWAETLTKL